MALTRPSPGAERSGAAPAERAVLTRSPIYLFTLVLGTLVAALGWVLATMFERSLTAAAADLRVLLPEPVEAFIPSLLTVVTVVAVILIHVWLLYARQFRRLGLAYAALGLGMALAFAAGHALLAVARPGTRALFEAADAARTLPTDPAIAGVVAVLVLMRKWIPLRGRRVLYGAVPLWLLCSLGGPPPPHLAVILDVGIGMIAGSLVPLVLRTPTPRPSRTALVAGLAANGLHLVDLRTAHVDARGSEPWFGTTTDGATVFVKALSSEQRVADLMFRAARWLRLRRTGDAPPEISLQRAAEHEAFLSHHVRSVGMPSPRLLTVVDLGDDNVALAYEGIAGRSLDHVDPAEVSDRLLEALWRQVATLRSHGIAHRDLRLANVFLTDDGDAVLIDFGFGELSASQQLLDTDVAELLAATSALVGVDRAVAAAVASLGPDVVVGAREWLLPGTLTSATRKAVHESDCLQALREAIDDVGRRDPAIATTAARPVATPRLALVAVATFGLYTAVALLLGDDLGSRLADVDWLRAAIAVAVGFLVHPARGLAFRSASERRAPFRRSTTTSMATHLPTATRTYWRWAGHLYVIAGHTVGLTAASAARAVATWVCGGLAVGPVLVTGVVATGLEAEHGYAKGFAIGALCGAGLLLVELVALRASPVSWDLTDMWAPSPGHRQRLLGSAVGATLWWFVARGVESLAFVLIARSAGPVAATESLVAIWVGAGAVASLWPGPAHLWVTELLVFVGLVAVGVDPGGAAFAAVTGRVVTFWVQVPVARWAYRALMHRRVDDGGGT